MVAEQLQHRGFIKWEQRLEQNKQRVWDEMRPEMQKERSEAEGNEGKKKEKGEAGSRSRNF